MVMIPPEVVLILASSTVFVKASSLVNLDLGAIFSDVRLRALCRAQGRRRNVVSLSKAARPISLSLSSAVGRARTRDLGKIIECKECDQGVCIMRAQLKPANGPAGGSVHVRAPPNQNSSAWLGIEYQVSPNPSATPKGHLHHYPHLPLARPGVVGTLANQWVHAPRPARARPSYTSKSGSPGVELAVACRMHPGDWRDDHSMLGLRASELEGLQHWQIKSEARNSSRINRHFFHGGITKASICGCSMPRLRILEGSWPPSPTLTPPQTPGHM